MCTALPPALSAHTLSLVSHYELILSAVEKDKINTGGGGGKDGGKRRRFVYCLFLHYESCYRQAVFTSWKDGPGNHGLTTETKVRAFKIKEYFLWESIGFWLLPIPRQFFKMFFALKNDPLKNLDIPARTHCEVLENFPWCQNLHTKKMMNFKKGIFPPTCLFSSVSNILLLGC